MTDALVVDDARDRRGTIRGALADRGYGVTVASDCHAAVDRVRESQSDVVVLGVGDPDAGTVEAVQRIVAAGRVPVVVVTPGDAGPVASLAEGEGIAVVADAESPDRGERVVEAVRAVEGTALPALAASITSASARAIRETVADRTEAGPWTDGARGFDRPARTDGAPPAVTRGVTGAAGAGPASDGSGSDPAPAVPAFDPPEGEFVPTVVVAASTGGPDVVETVVGGLPRDLDARVLVVQHMPEPFTGRLAARLDAASEYDVREATDGARVGGGEALVAKGDRHLRVAGATGGRLRVSLDDGDPVHGVRPAADVTMRSAAEHAPGPLVAVVLTGIGRDGAAGVEAVRAAGGVAFAQDRATSTAPGMPAQAVATGAVTESLPARAIPAAICERLRREGDQQ